MRSTIKICRLRLLHLLLDEGVAINHSAEEPLLQIVFSTVVFEVEELVSLLELLVKALEAYEVVFTVA